MGAKVFHPGLGAGTVTGHDGKSVKVRFNVGGERSFEARHGGGTGRLEKHAEPSKPKAEPKAKASEPKTATPKPVEPKPANSAAKAPPAKPATAAPKAAPASRDYPKMTTKQAEKWGKDGWPSTSPPLARDQYDALREYSGGWYSVINGYLRTGKADDPDVKKAVASMDREMRDHPTPSKATVVYRGVGLDAFGGTTPDKLIGRSVREPGFLSTSVGSGVAGGFAHHHVQMDIKVPEGTPAFYLDNLGAFKGERELLLARGLQYKITSAKKRRDGTWQVQAEIVPVAKKLAGDAAGIELAGPVPDPSAMARQVYRKLRAKGVKHGQALAMAKRAAAMHAKATAKAA